MPDVKIGRRKRKERQYVLIFKAEKNDNNGEETSSRLKVCLFSPPLLTAHSQRGMGGWSFENKDELGTGAGCGVGRQRLKWSGVGKKSVVRCKIVKTNWIEISEVSSFFQEVSFDIFLWYEKLK